MSEKDRRTAFLDEMGVGPLWRKRGPGIDKPAAPDAGGMDAVSRGVSASAGDGPDAAPKPSPAVVAVGGRPATGTPFPGASARPAAPPDLWDETPAAPVLFDPAPALFDTPPSATGAAPADSEVANMPWDPLQSAVATCVKCRLCEGRTNTVFGVGDPQAKWLFIGEGPGRNEDLRGEPFVGPAGKLLDNMLIAMGLRRGENAYIANIVKCRPTDANGKDRPPTREEVAACLPYLRRQIALIRPTVLVALGKTAALSLLDLDPNTPVSTLRGTVHRYADLPLIVTYHPAYLLRNLPDKRKAWADLCLAMDTFAANGEAHA